MALISYSKVPVSRGVEGHGIAPPQGILFTDAELQAVREAKKKEMSHLVQGMNDDPTNKEEMEELAQDLRVKFLVEPIEVPKKKSAAHHQSDSTNDLRKAMDASALEPKQKKAAAPPEVWFGMVQKNCGTNWVTRNPFEATIAASKKVSHIEQVLHTEDKAEAWPFGSFLEKGSDEDSDSEISPALIPHKSPVIAYDSDDESRAPSLSINKSGRQAASSLSGEEMRTEGTQTPKYEGHEEEGIARA